MASYFHIFAIVNNYGRNMENDEKDGKYYDKPRKTQIWVECAQNVCQKAGFPFPASQKGFREQQSGLRVGESVAASRWFRNRSLTAASSF